MDSTNISFYLRNNRIHIFVEALRGIGSPRYVYFLMGENGDSLVMAPYDKKDFYSHRVSPSVYDGKKSLELTSIRLCRLLAQMFNWDTDKSYRVPGVVIPKQQIAIFYLGKAVIIEH